jgi:hypothetical protein
MGKRFILSLPWRIPVEIMRRGGIVVKAETTFLPSVQTFWGGPRVLCIGF